MKRGKLLLTLLCTAGLLTACGGEKKQAEETSPEKILNLTESSELSTMDSTLATDAYSFNAIAATTEGLLQIDKDGKVIPGMAETVEVSEDGRIYTFKLRDAKWTDGQPVTANDFVFAWRRLVNPDTAAEYAYMMDVAGVKNAQDIMLGKKPITDLGVKAVDDKTLVVELTKSVPFFKSLMAFPSFFPIREDFYKAQGDQYGLTPENILANGPFKMVTWDQGANYTMEKNDGYYDAASVKLDGLNFQVIKEEQAAVVAYEQGAVDVLKFTGELASFYGTNPDYTTIPSGSLTYITINVGVPGLENENLRKAIAMSFDKEQIANNILKDGSVAANFAVPMQLAVGPDGKDFREGRNNYLATNKEKAREYYELAKKELGKDTFTYEFLFNDTESNKKLAEFFKSEVETNLPGVTVNLKQVPFKERLSLTSNHEYEIAISSWSPDYADPMTYLDMWITGAAYNYGNWSNPEYDEMIISASSGEISNNLVERWEVMKKAEELLLDEAVIAPVYQKGQAGLIKPNVKGIEFHSVGVNEIYKNATKE